MRLASRKSKTFPSRTLILWQAGVFTFSLSILGLADSLEWAEEKEEEEEGKVKRN